jgi:hypothetical protein
LYIDNSISGVKWKNQIYSNITSNEVDYIKYLTFDQSASNIAALVYPDAAIVILTASDGTIQSSLKFTIAYGIAAFS